MTALWVFIRKAWDNEIVRGMAAALALFATAVLYTKRQQHVGAERRRREEVEEDRERLEEIENTSKDIIERAEEVSTGADAYGDDRLSDEPLPDAHYRD